MFKHWSLRTNLLHLANRALLTLDFWRATRTTEPIFRAVLWFDYYDGDRSSHEKGVHGLWSHEEHHAHWTRLRQERGLNLQDGEDPRMPVIGSHPSRARALGRIDRDDGRTRRSTEAILAFFRLDEETLPPSTLALARQELRAAYDATYDLPPQAPMVVGSSGNASN